MADIAAVVQEQREFFTGGQTRDVAFRVAALQRLERWILAHDEDVLAALKADLNKARFESYATEVGAVLDELRFAAKRTRRWSRPQRVRGNLKNFPSSGRICPEPYGVALIMSPWNYPFFLTMGPLIAALAAGNCAVIKPSAYSAATSALLARLCAEVFDPAHVQVIQGGRDENRALLEQRYDIILFTGSKAVGKTVMEAASRHLTPVILELGGKSPCIVDETANIKLAARRIVWGKFINAGQTCVAPDYILAHASIKDRLLQELARCMREQFGEWGEPGEPGKAATPGTLGAPGTPGKGEGSPYARIINQKHFARLMSLLQGEHIHTGGGSNPDTLQIQPTLLDRAGWDSPIMTDEIFGPLLPVLAYTSLEEAVLAISARPKPLATYLFTASRHNREYVLSSLSFGGGCINDTVVHLSVPRLPFGGVGQSGMGCYHGKAGFDAFTHYRSVLLKSRRLDLPLRYPPYTDGAFKLLKRF